MKRKIASIMAMVLLAVAVLFVSVDHSIARSRPSLAAATLKFEVLPEDSVTVTEKPVVNYYLPYPGILPDHPLYRLKMVRDKIWLLLTNDAIQKAKLMLLYSNKRLGAGEVLIKGNKIALGIDTLWKAEKYLNQAVDTVLLSKQKNTRDGVFEDEIKTALLKHQETLSALQDKLDSESKTAIGEIIKLQDDIQRKINSF